MICDPKLNWLLLLPAVPLMTPSISILLKETSLPLETPPLPPPLDNVVGTNLFPSHLTPWFVVIPAKFTSVNSLMLEMLLPPPLDNVVGTNLLPSHLTPWSVVIPAKFTSVNSLILEILLPPPPLLNALPF